MTTRNTPAWCHGFILTSEGLHWNAHVATSLHEPCCIKQVETAQTFGSSLCCMFGSQGTNTAAVAAADPHRHRCLGCLNVKPATETASKSFDSCLFFSPSRKLCTKGGGSHTRSLSPSCWKMKKSKSCHNLKTCPCLFWPQAETVRNGATKKG